LGISPLGSAIAPDLVEHLGFVGQLESNVAADEDSLQVHPLALDVQPDLQHLNRRTAEYQLTRRAFPVTAVQFNIRLNSASTNVSNAPQ